MNNAGWGSIVPFVEVDYAHYREHFTLNLDALFFLIQARPAVLCCAAPDRSRLAHSAMAGAGSHP